MVLCCVCLSSELCSLIVGNEVLIGQTLLEKMDLLVDCTRQRLVPAHQEGPINKLK